MQFFVQICTDLCQKNEVLVASLCGNTALVNFYWRLRRKIVILRQAPVYYLGRYTDFIWQQIYSQFCCSYKSNIFWTIFIISVTPFLLLMYPLPSGQQINTRYVQEKHTWHDIWHFADTFKFYIPLQCASCTILFAYSENAAEEIITALLHWSACQFRVIELYHKSFASLTYISNFLFWTYWSKK